MTAKQKPLTLADIQKRVAKITDMSDEQAHASEDELHQDVLQAIAGGAKNPRALALAALATTELQFSRWYA